MTTPELLTHLRKLNVTLSSNNGQLVLKGPKGAVTATLRAELSERKGEILKFLHDVTSTCGAPTESSLRRVSRNRDLPLSFAQQRLWFLDQLEPGSAVYNVPGALRIKGPLDVDVLKKSLGEIVRRHEALRTTFSMAEQEPVQVIAPLLTFSLPVVDISHFSDGEREEEAQRLATEAGRKPFDLSHGPVFRPSVIRLNEDDHVLLLDMHHIVSDEWSRGVLYHELTVLYQAFANGQTSPLTDLPIQYADFAVWQREWLQGEVLESQLSYWKKQLDGSPLELSLPTDRPRPTIQSFRGARQSVELSTELTQGLKKLSRKEGVTLYMTLLAAFQTLLHRYTGQDDIVVGSPIANRNRTEIEGLIGFFVNTLVLRTDYSGNPTFRELLHRVREMALEAYAHQDLPFEKLVEELRPDRDLSRSPLFQVMFVYQNAPAMERRFNDLKVSPVRLAGDTAKFDLILSVSVNDGAPGLRAVLQYNTDLFDEATMTRMLGHFQTLLEGIVANPDQRISELALLTEAERRKLLIEWNDTGREIAQSRNVVEMFERQVELSPDAIAVVHESSRLTYQELNQRANQLAHYLIRHGVDAETHVAVCLERSLELAIGFLAILKAGGVYAPLDPSYPPERLSLMVQDMQAPLVVTVQSLTSRFSSSAERLIVLEIDQRGIAREEISNPPLAISPDRPAYLLYTSGSTGKPKGVVMEHRALANLISWQVGSFGAPLAARTLQFASLGFDVSIQEMFATWCSGGTLIFVDEELRPDGLHLLQFLDEHSVERIFLPFVALQHLADAAANGNCYPQSLREVITAGEQLQLTALLRSFLNKLGDCCLRNQYGPTESHVVTEFTLGPPFNDWPDLPSIGRPIANTQVYILDPYLNPVPTGVAGEIYIGGDGLARGYLNQPELTAEKFIIHSLDGETPKRLYKTGDLARYLPDGNIEFLGRTDHQVKIRGYRIELGEIEATLGQHPSINESVILAREDSPGDRRLVAYVVAAPGHAPSASELRSFLQQKLPEYMVPSVFMFLESLPVTRNGKVDRRVLPAPNPSRPELDETFADARTPTEELLANMWMEVLKLDKVGVHDNFFELGGHSLLATQVMSRLTKAFQTELPLRSLFEAPTVAGLAERIEESRRGEMGSPVLPLLSMASSGDIPLSFAQQRLWFLDRLEPNSSVYNIPSALRLKGPFDTGALEQSLNEIVRRHEALRTTFSLVEGQPVQRISPSLSLPLSVIDLSRLPEGQREDEARRLTNEEAQRSFDFERGPLVRSVLLHLGNEDHIFLMTLHHIASDGWSMSILHRELSALYEAFSSGKGSPLVTLPVQYADFAQWQREWLRGEVLATQLGYWKKRLENIQTLQLPTDRPRPALRSDRGARQSLVLSKDISEGLKSLSRQQGVTLFMTLLAAFQTLLYRYTGQEDIAVGSPIAGRNRQEIEGLIGFFVNTLVLRTDLTGAPSFLEVLGRVRESCLEAYAHQDLPFEKLVEELQPARNRSQNPLFQVMFILQNAPRETLEFVGLTMSSVKIDTTKTKFDLTLSIQNEVEGLRGSLQYSSDLFNGETISRMLGHFRNLLEGIVANPEQRINDLPILTGAERNLLMEEWNDIKRDYPSDKCIHQLFEEQVERTPEATAVVFEDQQLTYRELNNRANQLAHYLQKFGVGPEVLVGICVERSMETVVGLLGILKAGGAYVPLDPGYPRERLGFMLQDSGSPVLITQQELVDIFVGHTGKIISLDTDWRKISQGSESNLVAQTSSCSLAYVIYTSGSTGQPKGVAVSHRAVNRLVMNTDYMQVTPAEVMAQVSNVSFDAATFEIWGALLNGARLVLTTKDTLLSPRSLATAIERYGITTLFLTTALFNQMVEQIPAALGKLRNLLFGGEAVDPQRVKELLRNGPPMRLLHVYGPTETTTFASWFWVRDVAENATTVPIGRPIANTEIYILDQNLVPAPIGVVGEIYIGGAGLARGYLNCPELTVERFIANPFSSDSTSRLYKTGDLARYLPDGNIEFLGRTDHQVKIRGYRIELGEIETALAQHPSLRETVVVAREDATGDRQLIAYIVPGQSGYPNDHALRSFLKQRLPDYMLPSHFVLLNYLPLTPSGKIDRSALPPPVRISAHRPSVYVEPTNPTEEVLAAIWGEVLNTTRISVHDDFFELGGHSLLAIRLLAQLREECQVELSVRELFEAPTIAGLAAKIEATRREEGARARDKRPWSYLIEIQHGVINEPVFIVPGGVGGEPDLLKHFRLARCVGREFSFYGLVARGSDGLSPPHATVEEMVVDYLKEIRSLQPAGPYYLVGECIGGIVAYEIAYQLRKQNQEVALLAMMDTFRPTMAKYLRYRCGQAVRPISTWWMGYYYAVAHNYYVRRFAFHLDQLMRISWQEKASYLINKAETGFAELPNIFPKASQNVENASAHLTQYLEPAQERYMRTLRRHKPKPYDGKIIMVANEGLYNRNPTAGWADLALGSIDVEKAPGTHETYIHDHIKSTARIFKACLSRARKGALTNSKACS